MDPIRLAYGALHRGGAGAAPDPERADCLLLDGGPTLAPDEPGPEDALRLAVARFAPRLYLDPHLRVLAGLAGRDAAALARGVAEQLVAAGNRETPVGVVRGGDVLDRIEEFLQATGLEHAVTGEPLKSLTQPLVAACALLGHEPLVASLDQGARVTLANGAGPAALAAGAVAWAHQKPRGRGLAAARCAGQALAELAEQGDPAGALAAADLTAAVDLVAEAAPDGTVTFSTGAADSPLARRADELFQDALDAGDSGRHDTRHARVDIVYRRGYVLTALLENVGPEPLEGLIRADALLQEGLAAEGLPTAALRWRLWREAGREDAALGLVSFRHESLATVEAARARVRRLTALWSGGPRLYAPPQIVPEHRTWPTRAPAELLEWSVDVRPAEDWLD